MAKENISVSFGISGMERQSFSHQVDEKTFLFQKNGNIETDIESIGLTNEHSNYLCSRFRENYIVIGHKYDRLNNKIWFFLTEEKSQREDGKRASEIGFIKINSNINDLEDTEVDCGCDIKSILTQPLEQVEQIPHCVYNTLISDECNNCLNFDPNYPVNTIVLKQEACGFTITFASKNNPLRYIIVDDIEQYEYTGDVNCGADDREPTCLDCEKLRVFPFYNKPYIYPEVITYGGNLKRGSYEFYIAYCDKLGNELSPFLSKTNQIDIFDPENIELNQTTRFDNTIYAIKLKIENLDKKFNFYKIAVVEKTDVNEIVSYFEEGIHSTSDGTVVYSSNGGKNDKRLSYNHLNMEKPIYKSFGGILETNGYLMGYDYEVEKEWNLQPMVNLLGTFVKWQTHEANENLYQNGVNISNFKSYMRDEVYPLGISFISNTGFKTATFPFIARPPKASDLTIVNNLDTQSVNEYGLSCAVSEREHRWQFYNTGEVIGDSFSPIDIPNGVPVDVIVTEDCKQENVKELTNGSIIISVEDTFYNIKDWVDTHYDDICNPSSEYYHIQLCDLITDTTTTPCDFSNIFPFPLTGEGIVGTCSLPQFISSKLTISEVGNEEIIPKEKRYPWEPVDSRPVYEHSQSEGQCNQFPPVITDVKKNLDITEDFSLELPIINLKERVDVYDNNICGSSSSINSMAQFFLPEYSGVIRTTVKNQGEFPGIIRYRGHFIENSSTNPVVIPYTPGVLDPSPYKSNILTDINGSTQIGFDTKIHKKALWYEIDFSAQNEYFLEITPCKNNNSDITTLIADDVRYTIFSDCKNYNILDGGVYKSDVGLFKKLKKSDFGNKQRVYLCLDTKIVTREVIKNNYWSGDYQISYITNIITTTTIPGCFDVKYRPIEYYEVEVKFSFIKIDKISTYESTCVYNKPPENDCGATPHKYGIFSYWESIEEYPDNSDLYDSSIFKIKKNVLNHEDSGVLSLFENYYTSGLNTNGEYLWKQNNGKYLSDFTCEPIRHFKFPDNSIIPFMTTLPQTAFAMSRIFPIGFTLDERTIEVFLDAAVDSNLITQEQRESIVGYELYRGDRTTDKSIIYKGILNDMYEDKYQSNSNQTTYFRNFPYNSLGKNPYLTENSDRTILIDHQDNSVRNNRFSLIAPEVYHGRMRIPSEMSIDGYVYGSSIGSFTDVKDHSEWVLLGGRAYDKASKLANAEVILEAALNLANMIIQTSGQLWFMVGFAGGSNAIGVVVGAVAMAAYIAVEVIQADKFKKPKYKAQWLEIFDSRGSVFNFASMFVSPKGYYNFFKPVTTVGNKLRGIATGKYLNNGLEAMTEKDGNSAKTVIVNNKDRENSVYLYTGSEYPINYPDDYINYDNYSNSPRNSSRYLSSDASCDSNSNSVRRIASPYITLKNYVPDQYGEIGEIKWSSINHNSDFEDQSKPIFGGDSFISRVDLKNKFKFFNKNAVGLANRIPFKYSRSSNVGYSRFYVDHKSSNIGIGTDEIPFVSSDYNMDCKPNLQVFYEGTPSKFYLFSYGVPYFLVESEINCNFRYAGLEPHEQFASRGVNVEEWVQETNVSIAHNNIFYYNDVYSRNQTSLLYRTLPSTYDRKFFDCIASSENGVAWSEQDNSEVSLSDPWRVFKPFNIFRFPFSFGKLISLNSIESTQVVGRFTDNMAVFNAVDVLRDRINPDNKTLGTGGIFATRPVQYSFTELGDTGSQSRTMVSCEFGHYWVDAKRGKIYHLEPNAKGLNIISDYKKSGGESGMRKWFKRHLPFKILNQGIDNIKDVDIDNPYKAIGILMWWDSKFKRVFITKLDYKIKPQYKGKITFKDGNFYNDENVEISVKDTQYFKDVSWTIAYSPIYDSWVSYYDYKPNFAISHNDFFQTGLNYSTDESEKGLWSHLLSNKSYQVFYGKYYPWTIEIPIKNNYTNNVLKDLKIWTISQRYHDNFDYAVWRKKSFNKLTIFNQTNNSGLLHLMYDDSMNKSKYPLSISRTEQGIQASHLDEQVNVNYFYNRVKNEENHVPIWNWDDNEIEKQLNPNTISFNSKRVLERLRGDWFTLRLTMDHSSQFKHYYKWIVSREQPY